MKTSQKTSKRNADISLPVSTSSVHSGRIAVIGVSGRYPNGANSPELLWETLVSGKDAVGEANGERWSLGWHHPDAQRAGRVYTRAGGYLDRVDGFDAEFFGLSPREARQMDPQQRLLLELAWEAHEDAGIAPRSRAGSDTGVFVGISSNDYASLVGAGWPDAYSNTGSSFSIAANRISYIYDFHGPSVAVDTACSSSIVCVHQACMSLLAGECSTALAGGVSILSDIRPWLGFAKASMLSPTGRCKSFDASGDGYVRSEGGGLVLLKLLADAERDNDRILGVIVASGVNSDGRTMGLSMPNGDAQEALLRKVYGQCGVDADDVFYVEAHGTGTAVGDPIECGSLGRVLGEPRKDESKCLIGSVKSNIGHLEAASGIAGLTKVLLSLKHRVIPGNLHFNTPNPKIAFDDWKLEVVTGATPFPERDRPVVIGVNSFGFGGTNAHLALEEHRQPATLEANHTEAGKKEASVLLLSGHGEAALRAVAASYVEALQESSSSWGQLCAAAATTRTPLRNRLALMASSKEEAVAKLTRYLADEATPGLAVGESSAKSARIAFVYSGNGPQWWGMGRELLAENATFRAELEAMDSIFAPLSGWSLIAEMAKPESESRISLTEVAQPMLFALQLGLTKVLAEQGIVPAAVLGHSVGEVAAAFASGALTLEQATQVIFHRSREQAKTAGHGKMAALGASPEETLASFAAIDGWLELAATNSPQSVTVAGDPIALDALVQKMTAAGKFARVLPLNYPFHTKAMEPIREGLVESLQDLTPSASALPFISTVDGTAKLGEELDAEYWYRNVREPVQFAQAVSHLLEDEVTVFLEIGPHPVLKDYVLQSAKALGSATAVALPTLRRPGRSGPEPETDNLTTAICACHAYGASDLQAMFQRPNPLPALPLYAWQRERHWRGSVMLPDIFYPVKVDHPLLGHRLPSTHALWENPIDTNQLPYLKDHVVQDAVLFPAAGYIELSLSAASIALPANHGRGVLEVETFEILRPLTIPAHGAPLVQTHVDARDGTVEISSRADRDATDWTIHGRGRVSRVESRTAPDALNLAEISAGMTVSVTAGTHYANAARRGLSYGSWFQGVGETLLTPPHATQREALAQICLPQLTEQGLENYLSHPSLMDSCIQVLITLIGQNDKTDCSTIPVQIGRVRSYAPLVSNMFCHVKMLSESARSAVAEFSVTDADGNLLLTLEEARCQKVNFNHAAPAPLTSEWWRPDPKVRAYGANLSPLQAPAITIAAIAKEQDEVIAAYDRSSFYREVAPEIDRLAGAYAARALSELHPGAASFTVASLLRASKLRREQTGPLSRLIAICEEDGQIESLDNGAFRWTANRVSNDPEPIWRSLFERFPRYQAELLLLAHQGEGLASSLRGESGEDAPQNLFDQLQDTSPFQAPYNRLVRAAAGELMAAWPADRPIRILEIGGGGGGLASWVLPVLPAERADYLFTDASEAAIGKTEHRLAAHRFVRSATLDATQDFIAQGQPEGYFDLVLCAQAVGAANDTQALLGRIQAVMAPGAQLILVEATPNRFSDIVLGQRLPLRPSDLTAAGFTDIVTADDSAACEAGQAPQQTVWLAQLAEKASLAPVSPSHPARRWLLVLDEGADNGLAAALEARGQQVSVYSGEREVEALSAVIASFLPDQFVYQTAASEIDLLEAEENRSMTAIHLVAALEAVRAETPCELTFVTRGAFPTANGGKPLDLAQSTLWGLGRVIGNEHSGLNLRMIDVSAPGESLDAANWLAEELLRRGVESPIETEVQLCGGIRYTNRERQTTLVDEARHAGRAFEAYALDFLPHGGLDSLHLRAVERKTPGAHEVEIAVKAAGLNFRDVLWTMGMLPEEAVEHGFSGPTIGMECSGEVVRVGSAVTGIKAGDRVVAFASSCFGSHVTTEASSVGLLPEGIEYSAAATIPTAFITAYYAFDYLARLEAGETVLIHGAAGGVGLAAIQIAKMKGAKIIGTAGSARKRRMLKMLGVDHVLNSRSLEFAEEVMKLTGGVGVDVVLNSLAGEAITRSLQTLRPFGRFLEIGKRDLYANSRIGLRPFRNNLSYFGIDADTLLIDRAPLARSIFRTLLDHFASGALRPLPYQEVPVSRAAEAFRAMQQSRHVGKLVVSMELDHTESLPVVRSASAIKKGATYLVTGGLGGFGLSTAKWLAQQGASSLALVSRRGATTEEATKAIAELEAAGVSVRAFAADIADAEAVSSMLATIRAEMAPLAGIFHSAAVIEDAPILNLGREQLDRVFRPKLLGAWNLHQATLTDALDVFVVYSSSSAVIGNPGQGAYVAANLYLDALALYRRSIGLPALSVGWGAIKDAGFLTRHEAVAGMLKARTGLDATPAHELLEDLGRLLAAGSTRVSVARFDLQRLAQMLPGARVPRFLPIVPKGAAAGLQAEETLAEVLKTVPSAEHRGFVVARVREHAARVLGTSAAQVPVDQPLANLGLDSLMAVELAGGLERDLGRPISVMQMLSATSLTAIADLVLHMLAASPQATEAAPVAEAPQLAGTAN